MSAFSLRQTGMSAHKGGPNVLWRIGVEKNSQRSMPIKAQYSEATLTCLTPRRNRDLVAPSYCLRDENPLANYEFPYTIIALERFCTPGSFHFTTS